jgi:Uma2 family endonuclease
MLERSSQRASVVRSNEMSTSTALTTAEEFLLLPDEDGFRHELINGEVIRMPSPGYPHGRIVVRLTAPLAQFVWDHGLGEVLNDAGWKLTSSPDTVLGPDISFITKQRLKQGPPIIEGYWDGPPDLAVEVLSPSERPGMVQARILSLFGYGVKQLWIVNPKHSTVVVYRSPSDSITFSGSDELEADDILPGFRISLDRIFGPTPGTTK